MNDTELKMTWANVSFVARIIDGRVGIAIGDKPEPDQYEESEVYLTWGEASDLCDWLNAALLHLDER